MVIHRTEELKALRRANRATTKLLRKLQHFALPGMTTKQLDDHARAYIADIGGEPIFAKEAGFPGAINTNPNDVVVHGVPGSYVLKSGDILTIDAGILLDGFVGDAATSFAIGPASERQQKLLDVTRKAMQAGIAAARTGHRVGDVSWAMQSTAEGHGCSVARGFCGHGLGRRMWEDPQIPFAGEPHTGELLTEGMVITIEPVVIEGDKEYYMANEWEPRTVDGSWVAQFERAILVTKHGGVVLSGD